MGQDNTIPRRINRVEGVAGQVILSGGPGAVETWGAPGVPTKEFFVPVIFGHALISDDNWATMLLDAGAEWVNFTFFVPADFTSLTTCEVIGYKLTTGTIDWTCVTYFCAKDEAPGTHSDTDTQDGLVLTTNKMEGISMANALTGLAASDYVNLRFTLDAIAADSWRVIGLHFKYA